MWTESGHFRTSENGCLSECTREWMPFAQEMRDTVRDAVSRLGRARAGALHPLAGANALMLVA